MTSHNPTPATLAAQAETARLTRYLHDMQRLARDRKRRRDDVTVTAARRLFERAYPLEPPA